MMFILFNEKETIRLITDNEDLIDEWIMKLTNKFDSLKKSGEDSQNGILNVFLQKIERLDKHTYISRQNLFDNATLDYNSSFINKIEKILLVYLIPWYEIAESTFKQTIIESIMQ